ncbi:hypothetical protein ETD83_18585 [Actinomadura soli]|uniref:Uncharacterized protein n=1 Tax=Actinomadura soli TaxID=2508997 RepID=A0A5C4JA51_9ACTN|nr:hypothetical protein [Actinomadura soli]TMQ99107.1 hypothetical protein ETD83_18585 [Actinomadura soli]
MSQDPSPPDALALAWRPAPVAHGLATLAVLAGLAALLSARPNLLLLAAPPVGVLAAGLAARRPDTVAVRFSELPRRCFEDGALVIVFSPLLDDRAVRTVQDLRRRGTPVVVIDTLDREPPGGGREEYLEPSLRLWRLDRRALRHGLGELGVPVVPWAPEDPLDVVVGSFGHRVSGRHS